MEFEAFPKIPRLNRDCMITEKLDGTNAAIIFDKPFVADVVEFYAQSRKRIITPDDDNFGFAKWVHENAAPLFSIFGEGRHYGEWVGPGIQKNPYGLSMRAFVLFNATRWDFFPATQPVVGSGKDQAFVSSVPVLYEGPFKTYYVDNVVDDLRRDGSRFMRGAKAEGVVVWHDAARQLFKVTLDNDEKPKGSNEQG